MGFVTHCDPLPSTCLVASQGYVKNIYDEVMIPELGLGKWLVTSVFLKYTMHYSIHMLHMHMPHIILVFSYVSFIPLCSTDQGRSIICSDPVQVNGFV